MESIIECIVAGLFAVALWWWMPPAAIVFVFGFVVIWYMPAEGYDWAIFEGEE
jgi:fatty acid desaturase